MQVGDHLDLYILPTGRRVFCQRQVARHARAMGLVRIAGHAEAAVEHDQATLQLELKRQSAPSPGRYSPETMQLDSKLDRAITGLDSYLDAEIRLFGEDSPRGQAAARVRRTIFPNGVAAITALPYVQESEAVRALLARLDEPDMIDELGRIPHTRAAIEQVRLHHQAYHEALSKDSQAVPTSEEVRTMQARGQELLARTVALILAHYVITEDEQAAHTLMAPIMRQQEALTELRRRRRYPTDVDPETGAEVSDAAILAPPA